jgi:hypothetical protein
MSALSDRLRSNSAKVRHSMALRREAAARIEKLEQALTNASAALQRWDGNNSENNYADKFVWEAWDTIRDAQKP